MQSDAVNQSYQSWSTDQMPRQLRLDLVRKYGDQTLSYSTAMQTGLRHFGNESGFIAWQKKYGYHFALGDPITHPDNREQLIDAFVARFRRPAFCQIAQPTAEILNGRKYWINQFGIDIRIDLPNYDFGGKEKERFRYAANWLLRRDFQIVELSFDDSIQQQTRELVESWRNTRTVKQETAFINRPLVIDDEPDMRRFFLLDSAGQMQAFVFFDPLYRDGQVIGYVTSFKRRHPDAPSQAESGISKFAIEKFKQEGHEIVRLGLSPLAGIEPEPENFRYNRILQKSFRYGFSAGWVNRWFYNLVGHAEFKQRFRGQTEKTWFASPSFFNDIRLTAMLRLCRIL